MKKNKYIYFLFSLIVLFSFSKCVNAKTSWIEDKTKNYAYSCLYGATINGEYVKAQISFNSDFKDTYTASNIDKNMMENWTNGAMYRKYESLFSDYSKNVVTNGGLKCPAKAYFKETITKTVTPYSYNYVVTFNKTDKSTEMSLINKVEVPIDTTIGQTCEQSGKNNIWLENPENKYLYSCLYTTNYNGRCVVAQVSFNYDYRNPSIKSNIDASMVTKWYNSTSFSTNLFSDLDKQIQQKGYVCPKEAYLKVGDLNGNPYLGGAARLRFWIEFDATNTTKEPGGATSYLPKSLATMKLSKEYKKEDSGIVGGGIDDMSCEEVLGEDLIAMLQDAVNIVKVAIPILLIVLGTMDFGMAIFSSDENKMKDAQGKFIKRLIIAAAIFLIPSLLGVILDIANSIWGNIDTTLCGIEF